MSEMSEVGGPKEAPKPITKTPPEARAASLPIPQTQVDVRLHDAQDKKALKLIRGDLARFNLNLTGQNEPWQPTPESGLPQAPEHTPSPELAEELKSPIKVEDPKTGQRFNTLQLN